MEKEYLLDLDSAKSNLFNAKDGGGKFFGLAKAAAWTDNLIKNYPSFRVGIPRTFALTTKAFEDFELNNLRQSDSLPKEILMMAKKALRLCGGKAAVRSSANIEDGNTASYSGAFASVLNVTEENLENALKEVYLSAKNVQGAKMGIVIQQQIENPLIAGVCYSKSFHGYSEAVFNYVESTAANLLMGRETGHIQHIDEYFISQGQMQMLLPKSIEKHPTYKQMQYLLSGEELSPAEKNRVLFVLSSIKGTALINKMELDFGYPIDAEFADVLDADGNIKTMLLQQRRYVNNPHFLIRNHDNGNFSGHPAKADAVVEGEVVVLDCTDKDLQSSDFEYPLMNNKILLAKFSKKPEDFKSPEAWKRYVKITEQKLENLLRNPRESGFHKKILCIDNIGSFAKMLPSHIGNNARCGFCGSFMCILEKLDHIETGDYLKIDMEKGKIIETKKKSGNLNFAQMAEAKNFSRK